MRCWIILLPYFTRIWCFHQPSTVVRRSRRLRIGSRRNENEDEENRMKKNMDDALRRLDELGENSLKEEPKKISNIPQITVSPDTLPQNDAPTPSLETEAKIYGELMEELDENEESENYNDMMEQLGGQAKQSFDTYNSVLLDMGGTPGFDKSPETTSKVPDFISKELLEEQKTAQFMESALQEAIQEVKLNNPAISNDVLNDKSIMKEIEKIFEEGNAKLVENIEEIKREQREMIEQANAKRMADSSNDDLIKKDAERLLAAEASMQKILKKVDTETAEVEQAVADLESANQELENSLLFKLKTGGWPKQVTFVGVLLFTGRSMIDSVTAVTSGNPDALTTALIQGGIALVCGLLFSIL